MNIINPLKEIEFEDYREFCDIFKINSNKIAGDNGTDEELILKEIEKFKNSKWILNFFDNKYDGFFRLQLISE